jgi:hypothetical protein
MFLGYIMLMLFCIYSFCYKHCYFAVKCFVILLIVIIIIIIIIFSSFMNESH